MARRTQGGESTDERRACLAPALSMNHSRATNRSRKRMVSFAPLGPDLSGGIFFALSPVISNFFQVKDLRELEVSRRNGTLLEFC